MVEFYRTWILGAAGLLAIPVGVGLVFFLPFLLLGLH